MSDTVRNVGFEADLRLVQMLAPQAIQDATPVLSAAVDRKSYPRMRCLLIANVKEVTPTAHTIAFTVTESATSGGSYTAATTSGTLDALSADGNQYASIKFNKAKPFVKVTATGSHADVDVIVSAHLLFIGDSL